MKERGTPTGIWNSASPLATAVAPVILTALMLSLGWRGMFGIMGVAGIAMAIVWLIFYRDPEGYGASPDEVMQIHVDDQQHSAPVTLKSWLTLFRFGSTWAMVMGSFTLALLLNGSSAICAALIYGFAVRGPISAETFERLVGSSPVTFSQVSATDV